MKKRGKFIVIDGTDGSGKATQARELVKRLRKKGRKVQTIDFPRYYKNFYGKFIGDGLTGKFGNWAKMDPHVASTFYAIDRFESSAQIRKWLEEGAVVVADRYVSSNQIHQGGKILSGRRRKNFLEWLEEMEYGVFKIPRPDTIIYLDVPLNQTKKLMENEDKAKKKSYQNGKKDLHETDPHHLERAKKSAMKMIEENNNWARINCVKSGELLPIKEIADLVWKSVEKYLK